MLNKLLQVFMFTFGIFIFILLRVILQRFFLGYVIESVCIAVIFSVLLYALISLKQKPRRKPG